VAKFVIKGTGDAAQAMLKENLAAQDAKFNAGLDAFFKTPAQASIPAPAAPVAKPTMPAAKLDKTPGFKLGKVRSLRGMG